MSFSFLHPFLCPTYYLILQKFTVVVRQHFQLAIIPQEQIATLDKSPSGTPVKTHCAFLSTRLKPETNGLGGETAQVQDTGTDKVKRFQESTHGGVCVFLKDSRLIIRANRRNAFEPTVTHLTWPSVQNVNQNAGGDGNGHSHVMQLLPTKWAPTRPKLLSDRTSADFTSVPFFFSSVQLIAMRR